VTSLDNTHDSRFDEAEADVETRRYREEDSPNPLTIEITGWSTGYTRLGDAEFLNGVDRDGKVWSVLVGSVMLKKRLIDGLVEEWSDDEEGYVVVEEAGRVQVGEVVSLKFLGDGESSSGNSYPRLAVSRKRLAGGGDDDIPF
jgi:hypothetical protein